MNYDPELPSFSIPEARAYIRKNEGEYSVESFDPTFVMPEFPCPNALTRIRENTLMDMILVHEPDVHVAILNSDPSFLEARERELMQHLAAESNIIRGRCITVMRRVHELYAGENIVTQAHEILAELVTFESTMLTARRDLEQIFYGLALSEDVPTDEDFDECAETVEALLEHMYERIECLELEVGVPHVD